MLENGSTRVWRGNSDGMVAPKCPEKSKKEEDHKNRKAVSGPLWRNRYIMKSERMLYLSKLSTLESLVDSIPIISASPSSSITSSPTSLRRHHSDRLYDTSRDDISMSEADVRASQVIPSERVGLGAWRVQFTQRLRTTNILTLWHHNPPRRFLVRKDTHGVSQYLPGASSNVFVYSDFILPLHSSYRLTKPLSVSAACGWVPFVLSVICIILDLAIW